MKSFFFSIAMLVASAFLALAPTSSAEAQLPPGCNPLSGEACGAQIFWDDTETIRGDIGGTTIDMTESAIDMEAIGDLDCTGAGQSGGVHECNLDVDGTGGSRPSNCETAGVINGGEVCRHTYNNQNYYYYDRPGWPSTWRQVSG